ncbi:MAG: hypothetical protein AAF363_14500 [Bacteroidota bacterium]
MIPKEMQVQLDAIAERYLPLFVQDFRATFSKPKFKGEGISADSVRGHIEYSTAQKPPKIIISYDEGAEFVGKRKLVYLKQAPVDQLLATVKKPGFRIKKVPGYKNGAPNLSQDKKEKRVAFAIAISRLKGFKTKRKKWKVDALFQQMPKLNQDTLAAYDQEIGIIMNETILAS